MQTFPTGNFSNQKLGVEIEVDEGNKVTGESNHDYAMDAFKEAKELVNRAFDRMNPGVINGDHAVFTNLSTSSPMDVVKVDKAMGVTVDDIYSCKSKGVLETYKFLVKGKPELEAAYNEQMAKL